MSQGADESKRKGSRSSPPPAAVLFFSSIPFVLGLLYWLHSRKRREEPMVKEEQGPKPQVEELNDARDLFETHLQQMGLETNLTPAEVHAHLMEEVGYSEVDLSGFGLTPETSLMDAVFAINKIFG